MDGIVPVKKLWSNILIRLCHKDIKEERGEEEKSIQRTQFWKEERWYCSS